MDFSKENIESNKPDLSKEKTKEIKMQDKIYDGRSSGNPGQIWRSRNNSSYGSAEAEEVNSGECSFDFDEDKSLPHNLRMPSLGTRDLGKDPPSSTTSSSKLHGEKIVSGHLSHSYKPVSPIGLTDAE